MTPDAERRRFLALVDLAIRQREQWQYRIGRLDYWWRRPLGEQLRRVVARPNRVEGRGRPPAHARTARPLPPDELRRRALIGGMLEATRDCVPGRYPGSVVILWADEDSGFRRGDPERSWRRLVGHLTVLPIRGDHVSCVTLHLDGLAERLLLCLDAPSNTEAPLDFVASPRS
jgi:hypothetical protein